MSVYLHMLLQWIYVRLLGYMHAYVCVYGEGKWPTALSGLNPNKWMARFSRPKSSLVAIITVANYWFLSGRTCYKANCLPCIACRYPQPPFPATHVPICPWCTPGKRASARARIFTAVRQGRCEQWRDRPDVEMGAVHPTRQSGWRYTYGRM